MIIFSLSSCKDVSTELESVEIHSSLSLDAASTYCFDASDDSYNQFYLIGYYDDGSTEDLSVEDDTEWSNEDSSGDSVLSTAIPGLLTFPEEGIIILQGVYTVQTSTGETDSSTLSDAVIIEVSSTSCD